MNSGRHDSSSVFSEYEQSHKYLTDNLYRLMLIHGSICRKSSNKMASRQCNYYNASLLLLFNFGNCI